MSTPLSILLATSNSHKLEEVRAVLAPAGVEVHSLESLGHDIEPPDEDEPTFEANAVLKARYYATHTGQMCLADDSGLEVDALGGVPGVYSARYAGVRGPRNVVDPANNAKLIEQLLQIDPAQRTGRFVCAMALADSQRTVAVVRGSVDGILLTQPRGSNGFGYDPLFLIPSLGKTTAELSPSQKNAISHRGQAARLMLEELRKLRMAK